MIEKIAYIAEDGQFFATKEECIAHELQIKEHYTNVLASIPSFKGIAPFVSNGIDWRDYVWYYPKDYNDIKAINSLLPFSDDCIKPTIDDINTWICLEISHSFNDEVVYVYNNAVKESLAAVKRYEKKLAELIEESSK